MFDAGGVVLERNRRGAVVGAMDRVALRGFHAAVGRLIEVVAQLGGTSMHEQATPLQLAQHFVEQPERHGDMIGDLAPAGAAPVQQAFEHQFLGAFGGEFHFFPAGRRQRPELASTGLGGNFALGRRGRLQFAIQDGRVRVVSPGTVGWIGRTGR